MYRAYEYARARIRMHGRNSLSSADPGIAGVQSDLICVHRPVIAEELPTTQMAALCAPPAAGIRRVR
jgi:hypothetical protein